jgi:hypothetical protein
MRIDRYLTPWPTATPRNVFPAVLRQLLTTTTMRAGVDLGRPARRPRGAGKNAGTHDDRPNVCPNGAAAGRSAAAAAASHAGSDSVQR